MPIDLDDEYKSDECDEQTATALFLSAFFNESKPIPAFNPKAVVCLEDSNSDFPPQHTSNNKDVILDECKTEIISGEKLIIQENIDEISDSFDSEDGLSAKIKAITSTKSKVTSTRMKSSENSDSDTSSNDTNMNITPIMKLPSNHHTKEARSRKAIKAVESTETVVTKSVERCKTKVTHRRTTSEVVELSSGDEMSFEGLNDKMELNVITYRRGQQEKVCLTPQSATVEERRNLWKVDLEDTYKHVNQQRRYHSRMECKNCRKPGHHVNNCTEPRNVICFMCGDDCHAAWSCPNKLCCTCKRSGHLSSNCHQQMSLLEIHCHLCSKKGHSVDVCPDHWRRYHYTTEEGPPVEPDPSPPMKRNRKFCTWCGLKGHFASECSKAKYEGIPSKLVQTYVQLDFSSTKNVARIRKSMNRKRQNDRSEEHNDPPSRRQKRETTFGDDFLPIAHSSSHWIEPDFSSAEVRRSAGRPKNRQQKGKRTSELNGTKRRKEKKEMSSFVQSVYRKADTRRARKNQKLSKKEYGGIESFPSTKHAARKRASEANQDTKIKNRRKERRKRQKYRRETS